MPNAPTQPPANQPPQNKPQQTTKPQAKPQQRSSIVLIGNDKNTVQRVLNQIAPTVANLLPKDCSPTKLLQIAWTCLRANPRLAQCTQPSFLTAIIKCAKFGLYPDFRGQAWIIPRATGPKDGNGNKAEEAHFQLGYQGACELARRSGQIERIWGRLVCENDQFAYEYGTSEYILHRPPKDGNRGAPIAAYACASIREARDVQFEVLDYEEIERIKQFAGVNKKKDEFNPWAGPFAGEMWKKSAVMRLCKYLPASVEYREAEALEAQTDSDESQGSFDGIDLSLGDPGGGPLSLGDVIDVPTNGTGQHN